jgi:molybdopterin-dependent oxidoreductase alpha subunit
VIRHAIGKAGIVRGLKALRHVNQRGGFDCPGCAWPEDAEHRKRAEFCENGAKALADEATRRRIGAQFFARWSLEELAKKSDRWLNAQGRLVQPMVRRPGAQHYEPIAWDQAARLIAAELNALDSPDQAVFYASGRTSNEAAFLYQLFARRFGTNNLPDSSNMCHESSGRGLTEVIGSGKGTVSLDDFELADAIFIFGQNPGSNHPRMLATLQRAKRRGARIVAINPLAETGLKRFRNPQELSGYLTAGTPLADLHLPVRVNGDVALLKGLCKGMLEQESARPGTVLDLEFIAEYATGFEDFAADIQATDWAQITRVSGVSEDLIREAAEIAMNAHATICCWAMGMTQHRNAVANVQEMINFLLLRGNIGRPGAGACPVRGHSNVQGDRTMGITVRPSAALLDALRLEFGFEPPERHGLDAVDALRAMQQGKIAVFVALGGNYAGAMPDSRATAHALMKCRLTVQISTKLNRSHLAAGESALILPALGRTETDMQPTGSQFVTCENSMGVVAASRGRLAPAGPDLRSEVRIVADIADATLRSDSHIDWQRLADNYGGIRESIASVIPGFDNFESRLADDGQITLPHAVRDSRRFATPSGRAVFTAHEISELRPEPGRYLMTTIRSHDQFNTTVYSNVDRYRGIYKSRRVVLMNRRDLETAGLADGEEVVLTSHFAGEERCVGGFRVVPYAIPGGCVATYYPESNPLIPALQVAEFSNTPAYKSVVISIAPATS